MRLSSKLVLLLAVVTAVCVLGYNTWLYSCGACTLRSLMTPSAPGYLLLALNLLLAGFLLRLKRRQTRQVRQRFCLCGRELLPAWSYCPECGTQRGQYQ